MSAHRLELFSDRNDDARGWGRRDESWNFMAALAELNGGETWFNLDENLAPAIRALGIAVSVEAVMKTDGGKADMARRTLAFSETIRHKKKAE